MGFVNPDEASSLIVEVDEADTGGIAGSVMPTVA